MNCNCIAQVQGKLLEQQALPENIESHVSCCDESFIVSESGIDTALKTEFKITAPIQGYQRGKVISVFASYCPFCGKSTKRVTQ